LMWLGLPDPAACIFEAMNDDPDRELLDDFLQAWYSQFNKSPALVKDAINAVFNTSLREVLIDIAGERDGTVNRKRLGWWIKRHAGRVVNGLRLVPDTATHNAAKWKVESI
jgi:hypothetical protein